jgi:hypothetical protein
MKSPQKSLRHLSLDLLHFLFGLAAAILIFMPASVAAEERAALQQQYQVLRQELDQSPFGRPLLLVSTDSSSRVQGDVYARLDQSFDTLRSALSKAENWCDVFILHLNNKYCRAIEDKGRPQLVLKVGSKDYQELSSAHSLKLAFQLIKSEPDYFEVRMEAPQGPMSTEDYRIVLAAIPLGPGRSFIHLHYGYSYGRLGRIAMDGYLNTSGRNKVGFTRTGTQADGKPSYIKGYRGVVERNAMRYYLAIDAFLDAQSQPPEARRERSLARWYDGTEEYAQQLHEIERNAYTNMKRREIARARDTPPETVD